MVYCIYLGVTSYNFKKYYISFSEFEIDFLLANNADPDEMLHYASFHLDLYCLPKYLFRGFWSSKS